ncbi:MAG: bifunctional folylpolyglutamate synthase/dihydrofolate synthase [Tepidiformaceae bacterium]
MDYAEAIDYLMSFTDMERGFQASADPTMSLGSMRSLLSRLNDPHLGRSTIHITGSKGKGSTSAMVASILQQQGEVTALFTSPHLHSFTERIVIDGETVSPEEFGAGVDAIRHAVESEKASVHGNVSTFGILTALFFWLVRAQARRVRWQVVEVGLGGTFDATNVIELPDIAVITPVSLEHTRILGDTAAEIAADKAGIIKAGCTCVLALQRDAAAAEVIRQRCVQVGARLIEAGEDYDVEILEKHIFGQKFAVTGPRGTLELRSPMLGRHQAENAATAVAVADALRERGNDVSDAAVVDGIARARVHGRMEVMGQRPLVVADGAHNGESAGALAEALRGYFDWRRCFFVIGVTGDKDIRSMGFKLAKLATMFVCCSFGNPRSMDPYAIIQEIGFLGPPAVADESVPQAIDTAMSHATADDLICITGSLYVVAEAREYILGEGASGR